MAADALLRRLNAKLDAQMGATSTYRRYWDGQPNLAFASSKYRVAFGATLRALQVNWSRLVIDSLVERMTVNGFRTSAAEQGDDDAWRLWQLSDLDADAPILHASAMVNGRAFAIVWPDATGSPRITVESAEQVCAIFEAGTRRTVAAALKRWVDPVDLSVRASLFTPDEVILYRSDRALDALSVDGSTSVTAMLGTPGTWVETARVANPIAPRVPVVAFTYRPDVLGEGRSELTDVAPLVDAYNKVLADAMVASEFSAFRQRWATGIEIPEDPETGQPIEPFETTVSRLWTAESEGARFGSFDASDLSNYTNMLDAIAQALFSVTALPAHYFSGFSGQYPAADAIRSAESGLVTKVRRAQLWFGESWEGCMQLAFAFLGDDRATDPSIETLWSPAETRSDAEKADALTKLVSIGLPQDAALAEYGYSPTAIAGFRTMRRAGALDQVALNVGKIAP